MSGGNKRIVFNTRERVISSDQNRHQAFAAYERAELLRRESACRTDNTVAALVPLEAGSYVDTNASDTAPITAPSVADVYDGLVVLPQPGTLNILVSPGLCGFIDPDGQTGSSDPNPPSADDSRYKVVNDPGMNVAGALTITAGAGSTRIDLVEVRRQTVVLEIDSRDIFDPSTGVFVPVSVTKVSAGRLVYRVTTGTPGAGIPALSQGWMPLMVASVPSSATSVDTMTFWDVRPLVKDRVNAPFESRHVTSLLEQSWCYANDHTDPAKTTLSGVAVSQIGMYRAGGIFPFSPNIDARAAANQAAGYTATVGRPWYLYAIFPAGLPRWVKYVDAPASPRIPFGPLGIIAVSSNGPGSQFGNVDTCNPPPATGLVTSGPAVLIAAGITGAGPVERGFTATEGLTLCNPNTGIAGPAVVPASTTDSYTLLPNVHFPASARSVVVNIQTGFTGAGASSFDQIHTTVNVYDSTGATRVANAWNANLPVVYSGSGTASLLFRCEIPIIPFGSSNGEIDDRLVFLIEWSTTTARTGQAVTVIGWRL